MSEREIEWKNARIVSSLGCSRSTNGYIQFEADCECDDGERITARIFLTNKNGGMNEKAVEHLANALGWQSEVPNALATLHGTDWSGKQVRLGIEENEYRGKTQRKVAFLGAVRNVSQDDLASMVAEWNGHVGVGTAPAASGGENPWD